MILLIFMGLLSGLFFSSSFILNCMMSLDGGHWVWSASLRYAFMILLLAGLIALLKGPAALNGLFKVFFRN